MKNLGLIFGGPSREHDVSLVSAKCILKAIDRKRWNPLLLGISKGGDWYLVDEADLNKTELNQAIAVEKSGELILRIKPELNVLPRFNDLNLDVAFPIVHGTFGEDGGLQGFLQGLGIPYVGCNVASSAVCMDKELTKIVLNHHHLPTAPFVTLRRFEQVPSFADLCAQLGHSTLFVKPANSGSSVGVHKVTGEGKWMPAVLDAFNFDSKILVEPAIEGREVEVAVMGESSPRASLPGSFTATEEFYSYEAKYLKKGGAIFQVPAFENPKDNQRGQDLALKAYRAVGARGLARVDFFHTLQGEWIINEINTLPGFTPISMYPMLWEHTGLPYEDLVNQLILSALD